eukprot:1831050-Prymnesium_polylepis.1
MTSPSHSEQPTAVARQQLSRRAARWRGDVAPAATSTRVRQRRPPALAPPAQALSSTASRLSGGQHGRKTERLVERPVKASRAGANVVAIDVSAAPTPTAFTL